nr:MAG TPA: hypothetical protein [Caudoviricetes sp.]
MYTFRFSLSTALLSQGAAVGFFITFLSSSVFLFMILEFRFSPFLSSFLDYIQNLTHLQFNVNTLI